ncbi:DUF4037 domain-containing protein [Virgibacillus ndiopensis]|uniref:DUF4037 domain-containing protein n=1 Tax=Virgibacillus ndiopensis TaxID=2004408 RepID=UPI000C083A75|nr:DUF4037 domain-containing protein [Virgibacillus ndiopensis]
MELKRLASDMASLYNQNPKVEAVLLGGSVARGWDDAFSDIELFVLWKEEPTDEDRKAPIHNVNGSIIDFYPYEDEEWSETYIANGVKLEISNFLTDTIYNVIEDVIIKGDIGFDKQCLVATIHDGIALTGEKTVDRLQEKVAFYPDTLREAMIIENIDLGNRWNNREALLDRKDWLMLYRIMVDTQTKIMALLFGLNRVYVHHPAFKWQKRSLELMKVVPDRIAERLDEVFQHHPIDGITELELIIEEVYKLVRHDGVNVDMTEEVKRSQFLRPKQTK